MMKIADTENTPDLQMMLSVYSDMHKDLYGCRPSEANWYRIRDLTVAELEAEMAKMSDEISSEIDLERQREQEAAFNLGVAVEALARDQGVDMGTAWRWMMQAEGCENDLEHFLWKSGVGCGQVAYELIKEIREVL